MQRHARERARGVLIWHDLQRQRNLRDAARSWRLRRPRLSPPWVSGAGGDSPQARLLICTCGWPQVQRCICELSLLLPGKSLGRSTGRPKALLCTQGAFGAPGEAPLGARVRKRTRHGCRSLPCEINLANGFTSNARPSMLNRFRQSPRKIKILNIEEGRVSTRTPRSRI